MSATEVSEKMHQPAALNSFSLKHAGSRGENNIFSWIIHPCHGLVLKKLALTLKIEFVST